MRVARRCALAAGFIVIAAVAGGHVSARVGSGEAVQVVFARKLPNAPGKTLTAIVVDKTFDNWHGLGMVTVGVERLGIGCPIRSSGFSIRAVAAQ